MKDLVVYLSSFFSYQWMFPVSTIYQFLPNQCHDSRNIFFISLVNSPNLLVNGLNKHKWIIEFLALHLLLPVFPCMKMDKKYPNNPPVRWWCGGYCAPTKSTVYGAAFGAYPIGTCSAWGWILTAIMAHFIAFSASLWWEIYFLRILFLRETSVQKGLFGRIRWYVREIYTLRLCYGLLDDCFEVGGWVSFMPILTDSEMSIRGVSPVPWFVERSGVRSESSFSHLRRL